MRPPLRRKTDLVLVLDVFRSINSKRIINQSHAIVQAGEG